MVKKVHVYLYIHMCIIYTHICNCIMFNYYIYEYIYERDWEHVKSQQQPLTISGLQEYIVSHSGTCWQKDEPGELDKSG